MGEVQLGVVVGGQVGHDDGGQRGELLEVGDHTAAHRGFAAAVLRGDQDFHRVADAEVVDPARVAQVDFQLDAVDFDDLGLLVGHRGPLMPRGPCRGW
ncbi:hypothetical protein D9M68_918610 [compost metagenome]